MDHGISDMDFMKDIFLCVSFTNGIRVVSSNGSKNTPEWHYLELELMQFTGLLDKNGKQIYEGDVVQHANFASEVWFNDEFGAWAIKINPINGRVQGDLLSNHLGVNEVIGNIYENPELLERS